MSASYRKRSFSVIIFISLILFGCTQPPRPLSSPEKQARAYEPLAPETKRFSEPPIGGGLPKASAQPEVTAKPANAPISSTPLQTAETIIPAPAETLPQADTAPVLPAATPSMLEVKSTIALPLPVEEELALLAPAIEVLTAESAPQEYSVVPVPPVGSTSTLFAKTGTGITGTMHIDFESRVNLDGTDRYRVNLQCADSLRIKGNITRSPQVLSKILGREKTPLRFSYDLILYVMSPANRGLEKRAGVWSGLLDVSAEGVYTPINLGIRSVLGESANPAGGNFYGKIIGKSQKGIGILDRVKEYSRVLRGKKVSLKVSKVDPLSFEEFSLAKGPLALYPLQIVSGNLDYDYDTGNWLTEGIKISSSSGVPDRITGSIKWDEDPNRSENGKGQYEFNMRFNEERFSQAADEGSFFEDIEGEEAFFVVDHAVPNLSGVIKFRDTFAPGASEDEAQVIKSDIVYDLRADNLSKQQVCGFLKLWLLIVGPVNDE